MAIRVLLACEQRADALALSEKLARAAGGAVAATPAAAPQAAEWAVRTAPDVLLLESPASDQAVAAVLLSLRLASARTRVLVLRDSCSAESLLVLLRHGASGCLPKSSPPSLYAKAVASVHAGQSWFSRAELVQAMRLLLQPRPLADGHLLTLREREILEMTGTGLSNKEIARRLDISDQTVKTHLHNVYVKLHRSGRFRLFLAALQGPAPVAGTGRGQRP
jgi:DNA-binding NarL/FixJ family response regulator